MKDMLQCCFNAVLLAYCSSLDTGLGLLLGYNIYFGKQSLQNILKICRHVRRKLEIHLDLCVRPVTRSSILAGM